MTHAVNIKIPKSKLVDFCQKHHIRQLALFGSVLREDFSADSDLMSWWNLNLITFRVWPFSIGN